MRGDYFLSWIQNRDRKEVNLILCFDRWWSGDGEDEIEAMGSGGGVFGAPIFVKLTVIIGEKKDWKKNWEPNFVYLEF